MSQLLGRYIAHVDTYSGPFSISSPWPLWVAILAVLGLLYLGAPFPIMLTIGFAILGAQVVHWGFIAWRQWHRLLTQSTSSAADLGEAK